MNASIAPEVHDFERMEEDDVRGGTVRLPAHLRGPMGEGDSVVVVLVSVGCALSPRRISQRFMRRRKLCELEVRYGCVRER